MCLSQDGCAPSIITSVVPQQITLPRVPKIQCKCPKYFDFYRNSKQMNFSGTIVYVCHINHSVGWVEGIMVKVTTQYIG
jgi:hypothetical protein